MAYLASLIKINIAVNNSIINLYLNIKTRYYKLNIMSKLSSIILAVALVGLTAFNSDTDKLITKSGHINFFSHTVAEDISADNYKVISTFNPISGEIVFSVPMQSFEFNKAAMQKHYNSPKFLDTKQFPKAKFKGQISNLKEVDFTKIGKYDVLVTGDLSMHGVTNTITAKGQIRVTGADITATSKINIVLADYNNAFEKGKPSTNIAKEVEVTFKMEYKK